MEIWVRDCFLIVVRIDKDGLLQRCCNLLLPLPRNINKYTRGHFTPPKPAPPPNPLITGTFLSGDVITSSQKRSL